MDKPRLTQGRCPLRLRERRDRSQLLSLRGSLSVLRIRTAGPTKGSAFLEVRFFVFSRFSVYTRFSLSLAEGAFQ